MLNAASAPLATVAALFGLIVGSFLNVVIYRLPVMLDRDWRRQSRELLSPGQAAEDEGPPFNLATPRSACPSCKAPIKARHNVPVLSWLWLRGRCAACGAAISARYPIVEAFTGLVSALVALRFGLTLEGAGALLLCWSLIALAGIDLDHQILPDVITLPLLWVGIALALVGERQNIAFTVIPNLQTGVMGAMAGYLSLWSIYHAYRFLFHKEGIGYGDFKLLAVLGAWMGLKMLLPIVLISSIVGSVVGITLIVLRGRDHRLPIPFGPFLAAAGFIALIWKEEIVRFFPWMTGGMT